MAYYFTKKCRACDIVENNPDALDTDNNKDIPDKITILSAIRLKYTLKPYNVVENSHHSRVKRWKKWSGGQIPAIELNGNRKKEKYVGVRGLKKLAHQCIEWFNERESRKPNVEPRQVNIKLGGFR